MTLIHTMARDDAFDPGIQDVDMDDDDDIGRINRDKGKGKANGVGLHCTM
jgi:hypothetical protein